MKEYNKDNFEGHRNRQLRYNYGISHQEYMDRLEEQNYECAACGDSWLEEESNKNWPVDHDHKTKIIRGIVCERCNHCIGHAYDSADRLDRIANYLRKNEQL
jgi:DNA-directed RNA polymerase subunit RPC12/RpoP